MNAPSDQKTCLCGAARRFQTPAAVRWALAFAGLALLWYGFNRPLLTMPMMGEVFFHETADGGATRKNLLLGLAAFGAFAGLVFCRYAAGLALGAAVAIFLTSMEAIHRHGMERIETARQSRFQASFAEELAKGIQIGPAPWLLGTGFLLLLIAVALPGRRRHPIISSPPAGDR